MFFRDKSVAFEFHIITDMNGVPSLVVRSNDNGTTSIFIMELIFLRRPFSIAKFFIVFKGLFVDVVENLPMNS